MNTYPGTAAEIDVHRDRLEVRPRGSAGTQLVVVPFADIEDVTLTESSYVEDGVLRIARTFERPITVRFGLRETSDMRSLHQLLKSKRRPSLPLEDIILTTGMDVPGRAAAKVVGIISAESAMGVNLFKDIANAWRDAVGGRSRSLQGVLREAREGCLTELRQEAARVGADAVVAVDFDYSEFSSSMVSGGMVLAVATGTAVRLSPVPAEQASTSAPIAF